MALEVPHSNAFHDRGFQFAGWTNSSGESLICVNYMINDQPVNQNMISDIQDFESNMTGTYNIAEMNIQGRVNIGTEIGNPAYRLQVKGKIRSEEIKVEAQNWPDYVFNPLYVLPNLNETEEFIKENKHLPGMPSAGEVAENGIELGRMNSKLLEKIEELTLHLVNQAAEIEILKKRINEVLPK